MHGTRQYPALKPATLRGRFREEKEHGVRPHPASRGDGGSIAADLVRNKGLELDRSRQ